MTRPSVAAACPGRYGGPCAWIDPAEDEEAFMATFVPGLELARSFYAEAVRPIIREHFPRFAYAAALIGPGSEVLGLDSPRSMDHHWGPRVMLLAPDGEAECYADELREQLATRLPSAFRGFPTNFGPPDEHGVRLLEPADGPPIAHRVDIMPLGAFLRDTLGFDPRDGVATADWLFTPAQRLLELTAGEVFEDRDAILTPLRAALRWYPHDVWLFAIARQWQRIAQDEAFVGRCAESGDDIGAAVATARIVRDLVRLCFLFERRYPPYAKWLGSAFSRLASAPELTSWFEQALDDGIDKEAALANACERVAAMHNALGITTPVDARIRPYYGRPYLVLRADRFASATLNALDPQFRAELDHVPGTIDQIVDNTDTLTDPAQWRALRCAYFPEGVA